jgi:class 3 adenylate cyclase
VDDVEAFSEGTVGWVACRLTARLDTTTVPMRSTAVAHLERGVWRFVQSHVSIGVASETSLGPLTTTVEQLAAAVRVERPNLTETSAADGTVTIAFTDIQRSTDVAVRLGDRKWFELLHWHSRIVSSCVGHQSGRIVKSLGDGYMLAFASVERALRASIEIQERSREVHDGERLHVRIGLHSGEALRDAGDFFGHTVIVAARIAGAAQQDEILVSSLVNDLTRNVDRFDFGDPRSIPLAGLPGEHRLFPLRWRAPSDSH